MALGMSYEEYWHGDVWAIVHYRKAAEIREQQKNREMWLQGLYGYEALCDVSPILHAFAKQGTKPIPYRDKPFELKGEEPEVETEEEKEKREENERLQARIYMSQMVRMGASWGEEIPE